MRRRSAKYAETHKEQIREKNRRWYAKTPEARRAKAAEYREANRERVRQYARDRRKRIMNDEAAKAKLHEYQKRYREKNKEKLHAMAKKYRETHKQRIKEANHQNYIKNKTKNAA